MQLSELFSRFCSWHNECVYQNAHFCRISLTVKWRNWWISYFDIVVGWLIYEWFSKWRWLPMPPQYSFHIIIRQGRSDQVEKAIRLPSRYKKLIRWCSSVCWTTLLWHLKTDFFILRWRTVIIPEILSFTIAPTITFFINFALQSQRDGFSHF